jgi:hypothetical protein
MSTEHKGKLGKVKLMRLSFFVALLLFVTSQGLASQSPRKSSCGVWALTNGDEDGPRKLVVEVSHGLGNRMRAYATAAALSKRTGRKLELVWPSDVHLQAGFSDLFEETAVAWHSKSFLECARESPAFVVYDYLENPVDWRDRKPIDDHLEQHLYVRTAYRVKGVTDYELVEISRALWALKPKQSVLILKTSIQDQLASETGAKISDTVGVHVRMQSDLGKDIPGVFQLSTKDPRYAGPRMQAVAQSRLKCHVNQFVKTLRERTSIDQLYFIAADCQEARAVLQSEFGQNIFTPHLTEHSKCDGLAVRSLPCAQLALAELLLLSETKTFIYSDESSFSEIIVKLGRFKIPPISGCAS